MPLAGRTPKNVPDLDADECIAVLRETYKAPAHAFFEQVANGTGWKARGWCDALVMGIWPSRGLDLQGFEVKVSRNDWKKELQSPAKAENIQRYCDYWWIVAPRGLIPAEELPRTWGLIEITEKKKCAYTVQAPVLKPEPMSREFLAAILRRQFDIWDMAMRRARTEGREHGAKEGFGELAHELEFQKKKADGLAENIREFEQASGVSISSYPGPKKLGQAVKLFLDESHRTDAVGHLTYQVKYLRECIVSMEKQIDAISKLGPTLLTESEGSALD